MNLLITGGCGIVGSYVVEEALARGLRPVVVDVASVPPPLRPRAKEFVHVPGDIQDQAMLLHVVTQHRIDTIIHFAALLGDVVQHRPVAGMRVNVVGATNVLEAARLNGVRRMVFASTRTVYPDFKGTEHGHPTYKPVTEDVVPDPTRPYEVMKLYGEKMGRFYRDTYGVEFAALRFAMYYCAERSLRPGTRGMAMFNAIIGNAARGEPTRLESGRALRFDLVHARDLARAAVLAATAPSVPSLAYNIGGGRAWTFDDMATALRQVFPDAVLEVGGGMELPPGHYCILDIGRARKEIRYEPAHDLAAGIRDCAERMKALGVGGLR
ncbi:MAG: NAD(P)-dependent oxidoreductase [Armatimonadetes bacterium]|nr:NAD(P)-dependent oxidoreductase [Armatimonadota bacterium]